MNLRSRCVFEVGFEAKRNGQINGAWRKLSSPLGSCQRAQSAGSWTAFEKHVSQLNAFPRVCFLLALAYVNCIWVHPPVFRAAKGSMLMQVSPSIELSATWAHGTGSHAFCCFCTPSSAGKMSALMVSAKLMLPEKVSVQISRPANPCCQNAVLLCPPSRGPRENKKYRLCSLQISAAQ